MRKEGEKKEAQGKHIYKNANRIPPQFVPILGSAKTLRNIRTVTTPNQLMSSPKMDMWLKHFQVYFLLVGQIWYILHAYSTFSAADRLPSYERSHRLGIHMVNLKSLSEREAVICRNENLQSHPQIAICK